ncbi:TetR family transcriptional regulator [Gordonia sp. HNM0687]|uniref:TetR family transcriptional regulator n=1 Tax=Gordonia mangrovi TaxID=2665643 RepID=A0A6L7GPT0_9ACTN|nr:TetR/AcrR family transcriptional regulator [Gordonia mangrovi]MXP21900.1 TetR family transcriptional regulator [Gordonia mangrovi]UVF80708.1 TetR/AcrR family transcriptional regulator [Gordonia mangrovi]
MRYGRLTMSPDKSSRRTRPADRKRQLVEQAAVLFADRGYTQVSLADIARAAGVTAPSVYRHFDDKQALLDAAVLAGVDDLETCTDRALARPDATDPTELIAAVCSLGVRRPQSTSLWRWASQHLTDEQNREVVLRTRAILHRWGAALAEGTDLSEREAVTLAWAVLSVAGSLSVHNTRLSTTRALTEIDRLVRRVIALRPASAPPLPPSPPPGAGVPTRRDEILDAAAALFAERGYSGVGVDDIGGAVGITGPSVYKHFSSKLAILSGIGQRSATRLEAGVMAAYASTSDPAKLLALLVDSYVNVITSTPDLSVSFNNAYALAGQPNAADLVDVQRKYVARWVDLLMQADPELSREQAAVDVHASLSVVNDAIRMRRGMHRPEFGAEMAYLMKGVLGI